MNQIKSFAVTFGNPGGDGKTTLARALHALASASGRSAEIVCGDAGNGAIRQVIPSAASTAWGAPPQIGAEIVAAYNASDVLIIDCGANSSTTAYNILDLLFEARTEAEKQGRVCVAVLPIGTNKPGSAGMAKASKAAFLQAGFQAFTVLNNRDGSGEYLGVDEADLPMPEVRHLASGYMSLLNQRQGGWYELLTNPPEGYSLALDAIAEWLQSISRLAPIRIALGIGAEGIVLGRSTPLRLRSVVSRLSDTSDKAIRANHEYDSARAALLACGPTSPDLIHVVERFQKACRG